MNRLILFLLLVFILIDGMTWHYQEKMNTSVLKFEDAIIHDNFKNEVAYHGTTYQIYGLQRVGSVKQAYEVFTPVYMAESTLERLVDENETTNYSQA